jgi:hypothetical protein
MARFPVRPLNPIPVKPFFLSERCPPNYLSNSDFLFCCRLAHTAIRLCNCVCASQIEPFQGPGFLLCSASAGLHRRLLIVKPFRLSFDNEASPYRNSGLESGGSSILTVYRSQYIQYKLLRRRWLGTVYFQSMNRFERNNAAWQNGVKRFIRYINPHGAIQLRDNCSIGVAVVRKKGGECSGHGNFFFRNGVVTYPCGKSFFKMGMGPGIGGFLRVNHAGIHAGLRI